MNNKKMFIINMMKNVGFILLGTVFFNGPVLAQKKEWRANVSIVVNGKFYVGVFKNAYFSYEDKMSKHLNKIPFLYSPGDISFDSVDYSLLIRDNNSHGDLFINFDIIDKKGNLISIKRKVEKEIFTDEFAIIDVRIKSNNRYKTYYYSNSILEKQNKKSIFY